ncbi:hypothetical protein EZV62_001956 [Acer yangbiense]|uniref:Uncharacterized protein n=1 Tax=Acer yangbiense TaxID=1000413 RepID=A0A5C7IVP8_9ROSI|nr:hypothetical protein EZV62_001956 [Acer yangbiense]
MSWVSLLIHVYISNRVTPHPRSFTILFKTLCASQPELSHFGVVCPTLPSTAGPSQRSMFTKPDLYGNVLPNVPAIFALLEHLNGLINANPPVYPSKEQHVPVDSTATSFGYHEFPANENRSDFEKWSLCSPGLEYPCEADAKMNQNFAERYYSFNFPAHTPHDNLTTVGVFLSLDVQMNWFFRVRDVDATISGFFLNSETLAECPVFGFNANQYWVEYLPTNPVLPAPTKVADPESLFRFSFTGKTVNRDYSQIDFLSSVMAQTNVVMPQNHPLLSAFGGLNTTRVGDYWQIWPVESSNESIDDYLGLRTVIANTFVAKS